jgi:transcriptional regulator with XRE-family HTH domain
MVTRIAFDEEFAHALRVRGLTLTELASRARVTVATASSAVHGRPLNVSTATRLARALASVAVVSELEAWARAPAARLAQIEQPSPMALAAPAPTFDRRSSRRAGGVVAADEFELPLDVA